MSLVLYLSLIFPNYVHSKRIFFAIFSPVYFFTAFLLWICSLWQRSRTATFPLSLWLASAVLVPPARRGSVRGWTTEMGQPIDVIPEAADRDPARSDRSSPDTVRSGRREPRDFLRNSRPMALGGVGGSCPVHLMRCDCDALLFVCQHIRFCVNTFGRLIFFCTGLLLCRMDLFPVFSIIFLPLRRW